MRAREEKLGRGAGPWGREWRGERWLDWAASAGLGWREGEGRTGPALGSWAGLVWGWVGFLGLGYGFLSFLFLFLLLFLFLIQTKFEFINRFEFKPHSNN